MATSDHDFDMTELDLLGPLIPNFLLETDFMDGLESADLTVPQETTGEGSKADQDENTAVETADDADTSGVLGDNPTDGVALELVNDPEKDQDLIDMMEVVDSIAKDNKEKTTGGRFPILSSNEKENILDEALSKSTKKQTKYGVKIFRQWLTDREKDATFENYTIQQLNDSLTEFYAEVRNTDGEYYAKSTLVGIRASINIYLRAPPFNKTYSIMSDDSAFLKSNKMFLAMIKKVQREGMDRTKHHSSISEGDLRKLRSSDALSTQNPKTLQRKNWFDLVLSFGRRGRENQRFFTDKTFVITSDDCGRRYVEMAVSETTKNHKGGLDDNQNIIKPRMYETKKPDCPVAALTQYLAKRNPTSDIFFQQPRAKVNYEDEMWYTSRPVGERLLNNMMVDISKSAGLSQIYTNHCVRATTVTVLAQSGVPKTDIMKITGHKSEASLESYYQDSSEKQKRQYSAILLGNTENVELVNDPEKDQDLIDMMEVVDSIAKDNKEKTTGGRFPILSSNEKENILDEALSKSTKKQTKYGVKIFRQWLTDREKDATFENYTIQQLNDSLTEFYAEVRNTDGEYYAKSTLVGIRASINIYLRAPPFNKTYSIMSDDSAFLKSNKMFLAMIKKVQREGMDRTKHHSSISEGDLQKLRSSDALSTQNPKTLQRKNWFDLVLSFGRRGRENQRFFTDKTFVITSDDCGRRYVEMAVSETTKNHKGGLDDNQNIIKPRMYETKKPDCPVAALMQYLAKRNPTSDIFFQQPRAKVNYEDEMWYTSRPVGERLLNNMMVDISKSAGLSQIYTNHCVRATTVTVLAQSGVPKTDIMKITGHKSEASLESYYQDSSEKQKRQYSAILLGNTENVELVNDPEKDQDLIDMMEVVDSIAKDNKEKTTGGRFPILSSNEKENILDEALSKSTKKQTKYGVKIFRQWLTDREKDATFENYTIQQLNDSLTEFYAEVRNTDGEYYAKSTLVGIRASINIYLRAPPFNKTYSIMSDDSAFLKSNKMFLAMIKKVQREGMDRTKHHSSISEGDLQKLRSSDALSTQNPKTLQRKNWFDLVLSFGRRGRENQRFFTDKTFVIKSDDCGRRNVEMAVSETTKNHKGGLDDNQNIIKPRMYETKKPDCPVAALTQYLAKRNPTSDIFFQQPRAKVNYEDEIWYTSRPVGERLLNNMMVDISKSAGLSQIYTNHCVRATTVTVLAQSGVPKTDIMKITGHKSEASLESYYQDSSEKQKRQYSAILLGNTENGSDKSGSTAPVPICTQSNAMPLPPNPANPFNAHCLNFTNTTQINNQMSLPVLYNKQFEVHNSTVQVFNYNITGNAAQP